MSTPRRKRADLREQQQFIVSTILERDAVMIVSAMGSGKTGATLTAVKDLIDSGKVKRVLIIGPKFVAQYTWSEEIETWEHTKDLSFSVCVGDEAERLSALRQRAQVTIVNKDVLPWLAKVLKKADNWPWDMVVIDESSMFKAGKKRTARARVKAADGAFYGVFSADLGGDDPIFTGGPVKGTKAVAAFKRRHKVLWAPIGDVEIRRVRENLVTKVCQGGNMTRFGVLSAVRRKINRIVELTGTPAPNGVEDLWGQAYLLDSGERLGRTQYDFYSRWFVQNPYTKERTPRPGADQEVTEKVKDLIVTVPPVKLVPDPVYIQVPVILPQKVMVAYREFERRLYSEEYDVEAVSNGVLANKLLQFANGSMYREDGSVAHVHDAKLEALDELITRAAGDPVMVFYGFKFDLEAIRKKYPDAVVLNEDKDAIPKWNAGKIKILLAHPASCAHGLNLQYGGHIAIWYGLTWSLELYLQANMRLPRPGQKNIVAIYQIIAKDTYDENAMDVLGSKDVTQQAVIDAFKSSIPDYPNG